LEHRAVIGLRDRAQIAIRETHGDLQPVVPVEPSLNLVARRRARNSADDPRQQRASPAANTPTAMMDLFMMPSSDCRCLVPNASAYRAASAWTCPAS
jgi:hypothetical protein